MRTSKLRITRHFRFIALFILIFSFINHYSCKKETGLSITHEKKFVLDGDGKTAFYEPGGVAVDQEGNIYVADSGNQRVVKFNPEGKFVKSFGRKGQGPGEFISPGQLAIFGNEIYVYDWRRNIQKFSQNGEYISGFDLRGGTFLDFDIDSKGNIYVGRWAYGKDKFLIEKYNSDGTFILRFCEPIEATSRPLALIINNTKLAIDEKDNIFVAFRYINKIRKFNSSGKLMKEFERKLNYIPKTPKHTPTEEAPFDLDGVTGDIFCDMHDRLFVLSNKEYNENGHLVDVLDLEGKLIGNFHSGFLGDELPDWSELKRDQNIYLDSKQNFYLIDFGSMSIHVFKILFK